MKLDVIEPEHLESLYYGNGYTLQEIGNIFDYGYTVIRNRMIEYGIPRRISSGRHKEIIIEHELLEELYHGNGYGGQEIADIFNCSYSTIRCMMKKYGIPRRDACPKVTDFAFDDRQKQIFEGCMLGDGGLTWHGNNCCFSNGDIHKDYLVWLQKQLGVADISSVKPVYRSNFCCFYNLNSKVIPSIQEEHKRWYPNGKGMRSNYNRKIIPKDIELTPIKLLFWYIGDGNYNKRDKNARFSNLLVFDEWELLSKKMHRLLDVDNGISICKHRKDKVGVQRYILRLNRVVTNKFFDMVNCLGFDVPECYQYKFGV